MLFPQFRKYKNGASFFIIHDNSRFSEYKLEGGRFNRYDFEAKILPDRNYIHDMLYDFEDFWESCDELEFNQAIGKP